MAISVPQSRAPALRSALTLLSDPATTASSGTELLDHLAHGGDVTGQAGAAVSVDA